MKKGFTLVEVVIAIALTGVLFIAIFGIYFAIQKSMKNQTRYSSKSTEVMNLVYQISNDLNNLVEQKWNTKVVFTAKKEIISGKRVDSIDFTRADLYQRLGRSTVYDVSYHGMPDTQTGETILIRRENAFFMPGDRKTGVYYPVIRGFEEFTLEFSLNGTDWEDEWEYTAKSRLPKLIRVNIKWKEGEMERSFSQVIKPPILWY